MPLEGGMLEQVEAWVSLETGRLEKLASISEFETSPTGHENRSVSWILDGPTFMTQVVVWDSGEFEIDFTDAAGGVETRSGQAACFSEVKSILESARDWVLRGS